MAKAKTIRPTQSKDPGTDRLTEQPASMRIVASATFAEMLRERRDVLRRLKLPPWLKFLLPYERRDQATVSPHEQQRFLCAIDLLIANGTYGKLVDVHAEMHMQHTSDRFMPWHRTF